MREEKKAAIGSLSLYDFTQPCDNVIPGENHKFAIYPQFPRGNPYEQITKKHIVIASRKGGTSFISSVKLSFCDAIYVNSSHALLPACVYVRACAHT